MRFNYKWTIKDSTFTKDKGAVFSCFSGGGGSSMGYYLAGYNVLGCNEIDDKMILSYIENLHPKYVFKQPIQKFRRLKNLPAELYNLDILDGSPPCSTFTNAGNRAKDWGKKRKFSEGEYEQVLDTLFFEFIALAKKLQPKIVIAENVPGITFGKAIDYVKRIYEHFDKAGYYSHYWMLDSSKMGVPQKRKRVFFIAMRKDLAELFPKKLNLINKLPFLRLKFNQKPILAKEILGQPDDEYQELSDTFKEHWKKTKIGKYVGTFQSGRQKISLNQVCPVVSSVDYPLFHPHEMRTLGKKEIFLIHTFPLDYKLVNQKRYNYIPSMSVPPVMMAYIADEIYNQWLIKIKEYENQNK